MNAAQQEGASLADSEFVFADADGQPLTDNAQIISDFVLQITAARPIVYPATITCNAAPNLTFMNGKPLDVPVTLPITPPE